MPAASSMPKTSSNTWTCSERVEISPFGASWRACGRLCRRLSTGGSGRFRSSRAICLPAAGIERGRPCGLRRLPARIGRGEGPSEAVGKRRPTTFRLPTTYRSAADRSERQLSLHLGSVSVRWDPPLDLCGRVLPTPYRMCCRGNRPNQIARSRPFQYGARTRPRWILPVGMRGRSVAKSMERGRLKSGRFSRHQVRSSSASSSPAS